MQLVLNELRGRVHFSSHSILESAHGNENEREIGKAGRGLPTDTTTDLTVAGTSCGGCESNVEAALRDLPDVTAVEADHEAGTVSVEGDADVDDPVAAVDDAGYEASA